MSELSPNKLDKLFQQGSEQHDFEYNPEAWSEMETMLDKDDRRRRFIWWWFGIGLIGLICFIWFKDYNSTTKSIENFKIQLFEQKQDSAIKEVPSGNQPNQKIIDNAEIIDTDSFKEKKEDSAINELSEVTQIEKPSVTTEKKANKNTNLSATAKTSQPIKKHINPKLSAPIEKINLNKQYTEIVTIDSLKANLKQKTKIITKWDSNKNNTSNREDTILIQGLPKLSLLPISDISRLNKENVEDYLSNYDLNDEEIKKQLECITSKTKNEWLAALILGGELSSAGTTNFSKLSWKIGAQLEYRFGKRITTSIGANYINKRYLADGPEYSPPMGFWTDGVAPRAVDGVCKILEIPTLVGFFPKGFRQKGFYTVVGLSSYFLLNERYNYTYDQIVPNQRQRWGAKNQNKHWLGIFHISGGYQNFGKKKSFLQMSPFIEIPLAGIGHGKVKLWGIGLNTKLYFRIN